MQDLRGTLHGIGCWYIMLHVLRWSAHDGDRGLLRNRRASVPWILVATLLGIQFGVACKASAQNTPLAVDFGSLVSESALAHIEIDLDRLRKGGPDLAIYKIFAHPEMRRFFGAFDPLEVANPEALERKASMALGITGEQAAHLLRSRLSCTVFQIPFGGMSREFSLDIMGAVDLGPLKNVDLLGPITDLLVGGVGTPVESEFIGGFQFTRIAVSPTISFYACQEHGVLLFGTNSERVIAARRALLGEPLKSSLSKSASGVRIAEAVDKGDSVVQAYLSFRSFTEQLLKQTPEQFRDALGMVGLDAIGSVGYSLAFDGPGIRERLWMDFKDRHGWMAGRDARSDPLGTIDIVPADCGIYFADRVDIATSFGGMLEFLGEVAPRQTQGLMRAVERPLQGLGLDSITDALGLFGPEYSVFVSFPGQAVIPDIGALVEIRDKARVLELIDRISVGAPGFPKTQVMEFENHKLLVFHPVARRPGEFLGGRAIIMPTIAIVGDFLLVTPLPNAAKNLIAGIKDGKPRLSANQDFVDLTKRLGLADSEGGQQSVTYIATGRALSFLTSHAEPALQLTAAQNYLNTDHWPTHDVFEEHLFGTLVVGRHDPERGGVYSESYSSIGLMPSYVALGSVMGAVMLVPMSTTAQSPMVVMPGKSDPTNVAVGDLSKLRGAILNFYAWEGRLPTAKEWPRFLTEGSENHQDAYLEDPPINDPWGHPYQFRPGKQGKFTVSSLGADGAEGGSGEDADLILPPKKGGR